jgi:phosphotransferase system enzyme I (PtsI)
MKLEGLVVSHGIALGKIYKIKSYHPTIIEEDVDAFLVDSYLKQYEHIRHQALEDIESLLNQNVFEDQKDILNAHKEMILDPVIYESIRASIQDKKHPSKAISMNYQYYIDLLLASDNPYMQTRVLDMKDVMHQLLRRLDGQHGLAFHSQDEDIILVAHEILPSDLTRLDVTKIKGMITEQGSKYSHTSIVSKSLDIPYMLGVKDSVKSLHEGAFAILDTFDEKIMMNPTKDILEHYQKRLHDLSLNIETQHVTLNQTPNTIDGQNIKLELNIHHALDKALSYSSYVDGVGLFRTELYYMSHHQIPSVSEQIKTYQHVLNIMKDKPVTIRLLDIGGDKQLPYYPLKKETNPFLGLRGIRLLLAEKSLLMPQLEAILKANNGYLKLLIPMVSTMEEIIEVKRLISTLSHQFKDEGFDIKPLDVGIMIELPSILHQLEDIIDIIDFASVGTNDLTQYTLGMDRMNDHLHAFYKAYHPFIFNMLKTISDTFNKHHKKVSSCGELAGDPLVTEVLIGLGFKSLSMSHTQLAKIKDEIVKIDFNKAKKLADNILRAKTEQEVFTKLKKTSI